MLWFKKIHLYPTPIKIKMDYQYNNEQYAVWIMDSPKEHENILASIPLTKTSYRLYKHE
jgi:hypothetical protein